MKSEFDFLWFFFVFKFWDEHKREKVHHCLATMTDFNPSHTVTFRRLLGGGGELGDGLGSLTDGVLGKLPRKLKADSGLDLTTLKGGLLVVLGELSSLSTDAVEDVVDGRVHHGNSFLGDSSVGVTCLRTL